MKKQSKLLALVLACAMTLGLSACGGSASSSSAASADAASTAGDKVYTIGICQLVQHPALDAATKGFMDGLSKKLGDKVAFDEQNAAGDSATCATICNQFVSSNVDLIMANATPALQAAAAATNKIPIVGTSVSHYATALDIADWTGATGMNVTGTSDLAPLDQQAGIIQTLFPDAKNVGVLYCSAEPNSVYQSTEIIKYLTDMGYTCTEFTFADTNDVSAVTKTACDASDVLYIPTDNTAASCAEAINNVAEPAKIPIVAGEEGICSGCGVATLSIDYYDLGVATADMAYEILVNGADPATTDIQNLELTTYKYVADRCEALGVQVPEDYVAIEAE